MFEVVPWLLAISLSKLPSGSIQRSDIKMLRKENKNNNNIYIIQKQKEKKNVLFLFLFVWLVPDSQKKTSKHPSHAHNKKHEGHGHATKTSEAPARLLAHHRCNNTTTKDEYG